MGRVKGVKEKLHFPVYDAFFVPKDGDRNNFAKAMADSRVIRFFVDIQNKTKLETNLQQSGVLPSMNTFEARALRVVASPTLGLPPPTKVFTAEHLAELIYNSVTTLLVGEKTMIEAPTFWFPAGAGVIAGNGKEFANHGEPDPMATFRFAEPVVIEPNQNFRVEMSFPAGVPGKDGVPGDLANAVGPLHLWVVLDGYLTRDVQ